MAEIVVTELPVNYKCPILKECVSLDNGSVPMCPYNHKECLEFIRSKCPDLYKELFCKE